MDVVLAHEYADLDAVSSLVAAGLLYPDAQPLRNQRVSELSRDYLALHRDALDWTPADEVDPDATERAIVVDTRKANRLSEFSAFLEAADEVVVWDHHPASGDDIEADELHVEPVGACTTLLVEELGARGVVVPDWKATLMVLGIYADTGRLSYASTMSRDVAAVETLLRSGAELGVVNRYLRKEFTPRQRRLLVELMEGIRRVEVEGTRLVVAVADLDETVDGAADVVQHLVKMADAEAMVAVVSFADSDRIQFIGRSRVPYVDVGEILGRLGGGGHAGAAGATRKGLPIEKAVDELHRAVAATDITPTRVRDLMTSPVRFVERDTTLRQCGRLLEDWGVTGAPVGKSETDLEAVVSERDVARARANGKLDLPVSSHMSHDLVAIEPGASLEQALDRMEDANVGRLPVVDGDRVVGIVTRSDIRDAVYADDADEEAS